MIARAGTLAIQLALVIGLARVAYPAPVGDRYPIRRTVRYRMTVGNVTAESVQHAEFRVYAPVRQTATQRAVGMRASHPFEVLGDDLGNQVLSFRVDLAPYGVKVVSVEATLALAASPNPARLTNATEFTRPEPFAEVDDPLIQQTALRLGGSSPEDVARRAYEWVGNHLSNTGYVAADRGALSALETGNGDCTESMYLFTALTRARQVPARGLEGFVIKSDAVLRPEAYHNWAEFYAGGTWHLVDPQRRAFGRAAEEYVAMRIISARETILMGRNRRFEALHRALEVRME